jgi:acetyl-CoA acetyltransferase
MSERARTPVILGGGRTPIGRFLGGLSPLAAPELGGIAIRAALERSGVDPASINEVIMGNVVSAPDYVINAGGLCNVYGELKGWTTEQSMEKAGASTGASSRFSGTR